MPLDAIALGAIANELNTMLYGAKIEKIGGKIYFQFL